MKLVTARIRAAGVWLMLWALLYSTPHAEPVARPWDADAVRSWAVQLHDDAARRQQFTDSTGLANLPMRFPEAQVKLATRLGLPVEELRSSFKRLEAQEEAIAGLHSLDCALAEYAAGDFAAAAKAATGWGEELQLRPGHDKGLVRDAFVLAADAQILVGAYHDAEKNYQRAGWLVEEESDPRWLDIHWKRAAVLHQLGRHRESLRAWEEVLAVQKKTDTDDLSDLAAVAWMAADSKGAGQHQRAEDLYRQVLSKQERLLGKDHLDVAATLDKLSWLREASHNYPSAIELCGRALVIRQKALGMAHPEVSATLTHLAQLKMAEDKPEEAEGIYRQALAADEAFAGHDPKAMAWDEHRLGVCLQEQKRLSEALALHQSAANRLRLLLSKDDGDRAWSSYFLAACLHQMKRDREAIPMLADALPLLERSLGPNHQHSVAARQALREWQKPRVEVSQDMRDRMG